jgi:hypothetical protein
MNLDDAVRIIEDKDRELLALRAELAKIKRLRKRGLSAAQLRAELRRRLRPGYDGYECLTLDG